MSQQSQNSEASGTRAVDLSEKQLRFVEEYLIDLNATQAALRAGYSKKTANEQGSRLLANVSVASAIRVQIDERAKRTEVTADRVVRELAKIGFQDIRELMVWDEERVCYVPSTRLTKDQAATVSSVKSKTRRFTTKDGEVEESIELELKTYDKKGALDSLARHLGIFNDKINVLTADGNRMLDLVFSVLARECSPEEFQRLAEAIGAAAEQLDGPKPGSTK